VFDIVAVPRSPARFLHRDERFDVREADAQSRLEFGDQGSIVFGIEVERAEDDVTVTRHARISPSSIFRDRLSRGCSDDAGLHQGMSLPDHRPCEPSPR